MADFSSFEIIFSTDFAEWQRYDIFIMGACSDNSGKHSGFIHSVSRGADTPSPDTTHNSLKLTGIQCVSIELYIYIVANTLPYSNTIGDNPPFECRIAILRDGITAYDKSHEVNQWGGATLHIML